MKGWRDRTRCGDVYRGDETKDVTKTTRERNDVNVKSGDRGDSRILTRVTISVYIRETASFVNLRSRLGWS